MVFPFQDENRGKRERKNEGSGRKGARDSDDSQRGLRCQDSIRVGRGVAYGVGERCAPFQRIATRAKDTLASIIGDRAEQVELFLIAKNMISEGETFHNLSDKWRERIEADPAKFLAAVETFMENGQR